MNPDDMDAAFLLFLERFVQSVEHMVQTQDTFLEGFRKLLDIVDRFSAKAVLG